MEWSFWKILILFLSGSFVVNYFSTLRDRLIRMERTIDCLERQNNRMLEHLEALRDIDVHGFEQSLKHIEANIEYRK